MVVAERRRTVDVTRRIGASQVLRPIGRSCELRYEEHRAANGHQGESNGQQSRTMDSAHRLNTALVSATETYTSYFVSKNTMQQHVSSNGSTKNQQPRFCLNQCSTKTPRSGRFRFSVICLDFEQNAQNRHKRLRLTANAGFEQKHDRELLYQINEYRPR